MDRRIYGNSQQTLSWLRSLDRYGTGYTWQRCRNRCGPERDRCSGWAGLLPPNARAGECYAKVMVPAVYKTVDEKVVVADGSEKIEITPARYEWTEVRVPVQQESEKLVAVPARFETIEEKVEIEAAHTEWRLGPGAKAKAGYGQTVTAALALGLPKIANPGQCFNEFYRPPQFKTVSYTHLTLPTTPYV